VDRRTDARMDAHLRPALLGRLCRRVDLITNPHLVLVVMLSSSRQFLMVNHVPQCIDIYYTSIVMATTSSHDSL